MTVVLTKWIFMSTNILFQTKSDADPVAKWSMTGRLKIQVAIVSLGPRFKSHSGRYIDGS